MTFRTDAEMCPDANDPMLKHEAALIEEGSKCLKALAEAKAELARLIVEHDHKEAGLEQALFIREQELAEAKAEIERLKFDNEDLRAQVTTGQTGQQILLQGNATLKAENEWLKGQLKNDPNGQRGVMCVYCGQTVPYSPAEGIQAAIDAATAHDKVCERNPLVARVATLEVERDEALAMAKRADPIPAMRQMLDEMKQHHAELKQAINPHPAPLEADDAVVVDGEQP